MKINNLYDIGEFVYLVTDPDQKRRLVHSLVIYPENVVCYNLSCGAESQEHFAVEISKEPDQLVTLGIETSKNPK